MRSSEIPKQEVRGRHRPAHWPPFRLLLRPWPSSILSLPPTAEAPPPPEKKPTHTPYGVLLLPCLCPPTPAGGRDQVGKPWRTRASTACGAGVCACARKPLARPLALSLETRTSGATAPLFSIYIYHGLLRQAVQGMLQLPGAQGSRKCRRLPASGLLARHGPTLSGSLPTRPPPSSPLSLAPCPTPPSPSLAPTLTCPLLPLPSATSGSPTAASARSACSDVPDTGTRST